jgi:signal transduction histidine kinase
MQPEGVSKEVVPVRRSLWRIGLGPAAIGFAVTGILLASIGASAWWAMRSQRTALEQAKLDQLHAVGSVLARCAEPLMAADELTTLRRIVTATGQECGLAVCRIVLPDGQVVADTNPSNITLRGGLPATWSGAVENAEAAPAGATQRFTLAVPGRGSATVVLTARPVEMPDGLMRGTQAGIGAICVGALVTMMLLHRQVSTQVRGIGAVRQALLAHERGQVSPTALQVNSDWGPEARAWNHLLQQEEERQTRVALEKTRESLQDRRRYSRDLTAACDALPQGLILVGEDLRAEYVNGAAAVLLRGKREEMVGADVATFLRDPRVMTAVRGAAGGPTFGRTIVESPSEEQACGLLRYIVRPVRREDHGVAMIIVEDITQQRVAERARNAFLAQATHELRTPLTNIRLYTEMALDEGRDDVAVRANCLNVINQETFRLDRMVADILSISEIEAGTMTLKTDDMRLDEVFSELGVDFAAQAAEKGIVMTLDLPPKLPVIRADKGKFVLGLHNLVGNALKYTPQGGHVRVAAAEEAGRLSVTVSDNGIGMSAEDCGRIFEKFYRANDPRLSGIKGSGLGLAIARDVIRLHGGDITVESELDKGSVFTLTIPTRAEAS